MPGTPRYTPAWEKTGNVVSRALWEEYEEFEEWEEFEDEFEDEYEEEYNEFDELSEYLDNQ